jgi:hypothetical protein
MQNAYEANDYGWNEDMDQEYANDNHEEENSQEATNEDSEEMNGQSENEAGNEETGSEEHKDSSDKDATMTTDEVVEAINDEYENGFGSSKMRIGDLVFVHCFDGNAEKAGSKNPKKETSYKGVCDHNKLKMEPKELGRCVRAAVQKDEFEKEGIDYDGLSFHALLEIAKLPDKDERLDLGRKANEGEWTVREIRKSVDDWKKTQADKAITSKEAFKLIKQLKGILINEKLQDFLTSEDALKRDLESEDRLTLSKLAAHMAKQMDKWSPVLDNTRKTITKIELADDQAAA